MDVHATARKLRNVTEPIAAGVYFAPEAIDGYKELGLDYFEGYFCSRSACLGAAPWSVVCAAFGAFKPATVESAVAAGWTKATPEQLLGKRLAARRHSWSGSSATVPTPVTSPGRPRSSTR